MSDQGQSGQWPPQESGPPSFPTYPPQSYPPPGPYGGHPGGYSPAAGYGYPSPGGQPRPGPRPTTVEWAFRLMLARAVLGVVSVVVAFALRGELRDRVRAREISQGVVVDAATLDRAVTFALTVQFVSGLIFAVLYTLLAYQVRKGMQWARIVTWVLSGIAILVLIGTAASASAGPTRVIGIVSGLLNAAIVVLLALRPTGDYVTAVGISRAPGPYGR